RESLAMRRQLVKDAPENPDYRNDLAGTLGNLAQALSRLKDDREARRLLDEAMPHHVAALAANPDHPAYRSFRRNNTLWLAQALSRLGETQAAVERAEALAALGVTPADDAADAAAVFAACSAAVARATSLAEADRKARAGQY